MKDIMNLGKIPAEDKFQYKRSLQFLMNARKSENEEEIRKAEDEHCKIVRNIELNMDLKEKIDGYKAEDWKFMIDDNFNFWIMTKEYVEKYFITKEDT